MTTMEKIVLTALAAVIALSLFAQMSKAGNGKEVADNVTRIQDGNTVCYIYKEYMWTSVTNYIGGISCVRIK